MNYSPDYYMRRRNQECGCNRNPSQPGNRGESRGCGCAPVQPQPRDAGCGCQPCRPEPQGESCRLPSPKPQRPCLDAYPPGMTYVPWQVWQELYNIQEGFCVGTIFRELNYPWEVGRCAVCK